MVVVSSLATGRVSRTVHQTYAGARRAADQYAPCAAKASRGRGFRVELSVVEAGR
jgi:hypothetical protein